MGSERIPLTTAVTCPTVRTHPAVIAQATATAAVQLGPGRFEQAADLVTEELATASVTCGDDREAHLAQLREYCARRPAS